MYSFEKTNKELLDFIESSPTAFHAVNNIKSLLSQKGFEELCEGENFKLQRGKGYYVVRNGSSLIAFKVPERRFNGFMIAAAHSDSPSFKLKESPLIKDGFYVKLSTEKYGGMIDSTWLDRPLSVAGRVAVKTDSGVCSRLVNFGSPMAMIPNTAIHLNRKVNDGVSLNPSVDLLPVIGLSGNENPDFFVKAADLAKVSPKDVLSSDLWVYNAQKGVLWGDFVSSPRLDDLQCVYASLKAFAECDADLSMPVLAIFDNEEVGSRTRQGADSTFMPAVLKKLSFALGLSEVDFINVTANSMMLSCDNAHGVHPNHCELTDANHQCRLNSGVVIKFNANQSYCTDALSAAITKELCSMAEVPFQLYANRSDIAGGSTLGNLANTQLSMLSADIGLAQLAMHSSFETAGSRDTQYMIMLLRKFFNSYLKLKSDSEYEIG